MYTVVLQKFSLELINLKVVATLVVWKKIKATVSNTWGMITLEIM